MPINRTAPTGDAPASGTDETLDLAVLRLENLAMMLRHQARGADGQAAQDHHEDAAAIERVLRALASSRAAGSPPAPSAVPA